MMHVCKDVTAIAVKAEQTEGSECNKQTNKQTSTHARTHARTHAHTHTHTHKVEKKKKENKDLTRCRPRKFLAMAVALLRMFCEKYTTVFIITFSNKASVS